MAGTFFPVTATVVFWQAPSLINELLRLFYHAKENKKSPLRRRGPSILNEENYFSSSGFGEISMLIMMLFTAKGWLEM